MPMARSINTALRKVPAWPIYLIGAGWAGWLFWQGLTGALGPEPINVLERRYGKLALQLLAAGLIITPLRSWTNVSLLKFRRALGLTAFFFLLAHFLVWALLDLRNLSRVGEELVKRPYITLGFISFVLLMPLAITSNNLSIRRLGAGAWRKLHLLTYPAVLLGAIHYVWLVRGWPLQPFVYLGAILFLLVLRLRWKRRSKLVAAGA
tara:strand:- start:613 stop:1233 length:621 start_codon:yes stop_codon:yes gene_type:complete